MLNRSKKVLKEVSVGDCVAVFTTGFDKGNSDADNIVGVVLNIDENGKYTIGTGVGILKDRLERNAFERLEYKGLKIEDVPTDKIYTLRETVRNDSVGHGQGYVKCSCTQKCDTLRCKCKKEKRICNSACHKSNPNCTNHD